MSFFSERRLLHIVISTMNAQRSSLGAAPVSASNPIGTTPRSALFNSAVNTQQNAQSMLYRGRTDGPNVPTATQNFDGTGNGAPNPVTNPYSGIASGAAMPNIYTSMLNGMTMGKYQQTNNINYGNGVQRQLSQQDIINNAMMKYRNDKAASDAAAATSAANTTNVVKKPTTLLDQSSQNVRTDSGQTYIRDPVTGQVTPYNSSNTSIPTNTDGSTTTSQNTPSGSSPTTNTGNSQTDPNGNPLPNAPGGSTNNTPPNTGDTQTPSTGSSGTQNPPPPGAGTPLTGGVNTPQPTGGAGAQTDSNGNPLPTAQVPGPSGVSAPTNVPQINQEQGTVSAPIVNAGKAQQGYAQQLYDKAGNLIDQRGNLISSAQATEQQRVADAKAAALQSAKSEMQASSALNDASLNQQQQDEQVSYDHEQLALQTSISRQALINSMTVQNDTTTLASHYGGFGSGAGQAQISYALQQGEISMNDLVKEAAISDENHANKLQQLQTAYRTTSLSILATNDAAVEKAQNDATVAANNVDQNALSENTDKLKDGTTLLQNLFSKLNDIATTTGKALSDAQQQVITQRNAYRVENQGKIESAIADLQQSVGINAGINPSAIMPFVTRLQNLGVDMSGFDVNNPTLASIQQLGAIYYSSKLQGGLYIDPSSGTDMGSKMYTVGANIVPTADRPAFFSQGLNLLNQGDYAGAQKYINDKVYSTLSPADKNSYDSLNNVSISLNDASSQISQFQNDNVGMWNNFVKSGESLTSFSTDPSWIKFASAITQASTEMYHKLYMSRLTDSEIKNAQNMIPNVKTDNYQVLSAKIPELQKFLQDQQDVLLQSPQGNISPSGYGAGSSSSASGTMSNTDFNSMAAGGVSDAGVQRDPALTKEFEQLSGLSADQLTAPVDTTDAQKKMNDSSTTTQSALPRTDRNNNPTAMTTDVAHSLGLVADKDYTTGDPFTGDNGQTYHTAKLLGDPIETTIKAIDNGGFTTKTGAPRWTYTDKLGLNNDAWQKMSHDEKVQAVQKMYKQEGGTGILFKNIG